MIGEFLDWLTSEKGLVLACWEKGDTEEQAQLSCAQANIESLLAEFFEIDLKEVECERRALLEYLRHPEMKDCSACDGKGERFIVDRCVQGQDYGPETEGHIEICSQCKGKGRVPIQSKRR